MMAVPAQQVAPHMLVLVVVVLVPQVQPMVVVMVALVVLELPVAYQVVQHTTQVVVVLEEMVPIP
jgi:hypothetical protein